MPKRPYKDGRNQTMEGAKPVSRKRAKRRKFFININERAQSINEVVRYAYDARGLRTLKTKWQNLGTHYLKKAIDAGELPECFGGPVVITFWIYFDVLRNRDKDNYYIISKAIIDAMVDLGLIKDDSEEYADFGGIKFRKADDPHIKVEIEQVRGTMRELVPIQEKNALVLADEIPPEVLENLGLDVSDMSPDKIKLAYMLALPAGIRISERKIAKHFKVMPSTIRSWAADPNVAKLCLAINRTMLAFDVPDIMATTKERALAGDMGAIRLFLEYVTEAIGNPQINIQNNFNNVELSAEDIKSVISNLDVSQNGGSATKSEVSARVEVID